MYKNQLQELAQRSYFNLPVYSCIREGPDHAPRFKSTVSFNGEIFKSPNFCNTLRQAEHTAAEVALNTLSRRGSSQSLAARIIDETGIFKNLLQETAQRASVPLPVYTTVRSGPRHLPVFTCTVELARRSFVGEPAKTKKQAEKNAAMTAWSVLKLSKNVGYPSSQHPADSQVQIPDMQFQEFYYRSSVSNVKRRHYQTDGNSLTPFKTGSDWECARTERGAGESRFASSAGRPIPQQQHGQLAYSWAASTSLEKELRMRMRGLPIRSTNDVKPAINENQRDEEEWLSGDSISLRERAAEQKRRSASWNFEVPSSSRSVSCAQTYTSNLGRLNRWPVITPPVRVRPVKIVCSPPPVSPPPLDPTRPLSQPKVISATDREFTERLAQLRL